MDEKRLRAKHQGWLEHIKEPPAAEYYGASKQKTGCHVCGWPLPEKPHLLCRGCHGWIVCPNCGACLCGWQKYREGRANGTIEEWGYEARIRARKYRQERQTEVLSKAVAVAKAKKQADADHDE